MVLSEGKFHLSEISINCWNIHGIWKRLNSFRYNKLNDPYILQTLRKHKIFGLIETHHLSSEDAFLHIDGFKCFNICRPKRKKASGGLAVYVANSIRAGVTKMPLSGTESIFLKLKKEFFGLRSDIYICFAYCVPYNSPLFETNILPPDIFEDLEQKLAQFSGLGNLILLGDMNSRTLTLPDYISDDDCHYVPTPPSELYVSEGLGCDARQNYDTGYNIYGKKFLELCKRVSLRILNGRTLGDLAGQFSRLWSSITRFNGTNSLF